MLSTNILPSAKNGLAEKLQTAPAKYVVTSMQQSRMILFATSGRVIGLITRSKSL